MTERRHQIRLQKSLECAITIDRHEYQATIIDISQEGISFILDKNVKLRIEDLIVISVADYTNGNTLLIDIIGTVKDITNYENDKIRCGCFIKDEKYTEYVQEQLIASVCGAERR